MITKKEIKVNANIFWEKLNIYITLDKVKHVYNISRISRMAHKLVNYISVSSRGSSLVVLAVLALTLGVPPRSVSLVLPSKGWFSPV